MGWGKSPSSWYVWTPGESVGPCFLLLGGLGRLGRAGRGGQVPPPPARRTDHFSRPHQGPGASRGLETPQSIVSPPPKIVWEVWVKSSPQNCQNVQGGGGRPHHGKPHPPSSPPSPFIFSQTFNQAVPRPDMGSPVLQGTVPLSMGQLSGMRGKPSQTEGEVWGFSLVSLPG